MADTQLIAGRLERPDPPTGLVTDIDMGFRDAIVVTVVQDDELLVETYELADVTRWPPDE